MDDKLVGNVLNSQDSMLTAYKHKFSEIQRQMKELRDQLSEEKLKLKHDQLVMMLEEERDWYREELQKADVRIKKLEATNKKLTTDNEETVADRDNMHEQLLKLRKESKQVQGGKNQHSMSSTGNGFSKGTGRATRLQTTKSQGRIVGEIIEKTPDIMEGDQSPKDYCHSTTDALKGKGRDKLYEEMIASLKKQLETEKKNNRVLKAEKVRERVKETELREFFIGCIEEVKKDIVTRQKTMFASVPPPSGANNPILTGNKSIRGKMLPSINAEPMEESVENAVPLPSFLGTDKR